ncbi:MarR family transcriptional regulator [Wukongibacter baidiensis]|uniref:MarR family winged helix-turn-helix transcriptional regulator n=1 Tax=Wukongibacter baidiensis TaxID=1723361 RepID=UPI003D7FEB8B
MANKNLIINSDMKLEHKIIGLLICIGQEQSMKVARSLRHLKLSYTQVNILGTLAHGEKGQLTVSQIKRLMIDESPNISRALNKLVEKGYVTKERSLTDQRVVYISITSEGREILKSAIDILLKISINLPHDDLKKLYDLLRNF